MAECGAITSEIHAGQQTMQQRERGRSKQWFGIKMSLFSHSSPPRTSLRRLTPATEIVAGVCRGPMRWRGLERCIEETLWETPPTVSCNLQGPPRRRLPQPTAPLTPIVGRMCVLARLTTNVRGLSGCLPGVFSTRLQRLLQSSYRRSLCSSDHIVQSPEHTSTHSWSFAFSSRPRHASAQRAPSSPRLRRPPGHVRGTRTSAHRYRCGGDTYVYSTACVFSAEFRLVCLLLPLRSPSQAARTFSPCNGHPSGSVLHGWRLGEISMSQAEAQEGKAPGWRVWDALQVRTFAYGPPGRRPEL